MPKKIPSLKLKKRLGRFSSQECHRESPLSNCKACRNSQELHPVMNRYDLPATEFLKCICLPPYEIKVGKDTVDISFGQFANISPYAMKPSSGGRRYPRALNKQNYLLITPRRDTASVLTSNRKRTRAEERWRRHFEAIIFNLRRRKYFLATCDVIVNVCMRSFPCHSFILMSQSGYFLQVIKGIKNGSSRQDTSIIDIWLDHLDITANVFQAIYTWMYTSTIFIDEYNIAAIWSAGKKLQMTAVVRFCQNRFNRILNAGNALPLWDKADSNRLSELSQMAAKIIAWNFNTVMHGYDFFQLNISKVVRLLRNENFHHLNAKDIQEAAYRWINYERNQRLQYAHRLLRTLPRHIRTSKSKL